MLVKDCMTRHPIMVPPTTLATEAEAMMAENNVRHMPVVGDGKKLLGLITRERLALKPDALASLDVWEITRYMADLKIKQLMLKADDVYTIEPDKTVERAARTLAEHKIGALPVIEENVVVGIITEIDLLRSFQEMLGLPAEGVRVTIRASEKEGEFAKMTTKVAEQGWPIMGMGTFPSPRRPGSWDTVLKIAKANLAKVEEVLGQIPGQEIVDIREVV